MWPKTVKWQQLQFGVEIEFIGGSPQDTALLPGWVMSLDELQIDETGEDSGSELKPPPLLWQDRHQIVKMLARLRKQGAVANWSCGLHVHVGLEHWGEDILLPLVDAIFLYQETLRQLLKTTEHRLQYCPPLTRVMRDRFAEIPGPSALRHRGRPQSHRCGINAAAWYDIGTVEIRYANGSLNDEEVLRTIELCLRFVASVGEGRKLPLDPAGFAVSLEAPTDGYPPDIPAPRWYKERLWLTEALLPSFLPFQPSLVPNGELLHMFPVPEGFRAVIERPDGKPCHFIVRLEQQGWKLVRTLPE